jgi:Ni/Co efflux regulator RcnB
MKRIVSSLLVVVMIAGQLTESAVLSGKGKGKERVMHDGPKVLIKSTALQHANIVSRQKNSDLHEIYLAPYRYVSIDSCCLLLVVLCVCCVGALSSHFGPGDDLTSRYIHPRGNVNDTILPNSF